MTTRQQRQTPRTSPVVAAFLRFVVCGGGVGLASSGALLLLADRMPMVVANALITVISTVAATELHGRVSFRSERRGWGVHLQSGLTVAVSYAFTTGALLGLYAVQSAPSALTEQTVYLSASALAGVGRFVVLRAVVYAERTTKRAPSLGRTAVAMAA